MLRIHSSQNTIELSLLKDMLERENIECTIKQENLIQLAGIMSPGHCIVNVMDL